MEEIKGDDYWCGQVGFHLSGASFAQYKTYWEERMRDAEYACLKIVNPSLRNCYRDRIESVRRETEQYRKSLGDNRPLNR